MIKLSVSVIGGSGPMMPAAYQVLEELGVEISAAGDVAIAPCLRRRLETSEAQRPRFGTLIFHPSILPHRRGPDAVRWAISDGDRVSGVTWFWCSEGLDRGSICEQEPIVLRPGEEAREAFGRLFVPAGVRSLRRALVAISAGEVRRVEQDEAAATYQSWCPRD